MNRSSYQNTFENACRAGDYYQVSNLLNYPSVEETLNLQTGYNIVSRIFALNPVEQSRYTEQYITQRGIILRLIREAMLERELPEESKIDSVRSSFYKGSRPFGFRSRTSKMFLPASIKRHGRF